MTLKDWNILSLSEPKLESIEDGEIHDIDGYVFAIDYNHNNLMLYSKTFDYNTLTKAFYKLLYSTKVKDLMILRSGKKVPRFLKGLKGVYDFDRVLVINVEEFKKNYEQTERI